MVATDRNSPSHRLTSPTTVDFPEPSEPTTPMTAPPERSACGGVPPRSVRHAVVEALADDEQHQLGRGLGHVYPCLRRLCAPQQHLLHREMVALDGAPGDEPIVHVQVEEPPALVITAIAMTDGRMVFAAARFQPERSDDREEPRRVGPMNQQVEIRLAAQRLRQPPVALPVTIAHGGGSLRAKVLASTVSSGAATWTTRSGIGTRRQNASTSSRRGGWLTWTRT